MPNTLSKTFTIDGRLVIVTQHSEWQNDEWEPTYFTVRGKRPDGRDFKRQFVDEAPESAIELKQRLARSGDLEWTPTDEVLLTKHRMEQQVLTMNADIIRAQRLVAEREAALPKAVEIATQNLANARQTLETLTQQRDELQRRIANVTG